MFSLKEITNNIYCLEFKDSAHLANLFLRYQEYYESTNINFKNKIFSLNDFHSWYEKEYASTYILDWSGFNIPSNVIGKVIKSGIPDQNNYDLLMMGIYSLIEDDSYLIGVSSENDAYEHELAHAMYFINENYKKECNSIINNSNDNLKKQLYEILSKLYSDDVINDEIQAYITTGENNIFENIKEKDMNKFRKQLIKNYKKYHKIIFKNTKKIYEN